MKERLLAEGEGEEEVGEGGKQLMMMLLLVLVLLVLWLPPPLAGVGGATSYTQRPVPPNHLRPRSTDHVSESLLEKEDGSGEQRV